MRWRLLGGRPARSAGPEGELYDGVDLVLEFVDGSERALGLRTPECFGASSADGWTPGHVPFRTELDPTTVRYWSFDRILWLGPSPQPCVAWTNAAALSALGIETLLRSPRAAALLSGPDDRGLPLLADVLDPSA